MNSAQKGYLGITVCVQAILGYLISTCVVRLSWPYFWVAHYEDLLLLRPEAATVGCCRRQQHLWSHRSPYSRPEASIFSCGQRPQDFLTHMSGRMVTIIQNNPQLLEYIFFELLKSEPYWLSYPLIVRKKYISITSHIVNSRVFENCLYSHISEGKKIFMNGQMLTLQQIIEF